MYLSDFEEKLYQLCKNSQYSIALPESRDSRVLQAADYLLKSQSVREVLLFIEASEFKDLAKRAGLAEGPHQTGFAFVGACNPAIEEKTKDHINNFFSLKQKKISPTELTKLACSPLVQAGYLCAQGLAHACVAGAVHTTAEVIRAGLMTVGCLPGVSTVSGAFFMVKSQAPANQQLLLFADCGVVIEPRSEQLVDIAAASVETWQGVVGDATPAAVAFLSFSTRGSATHTTVDKVKAAVAGFQLRWPEVCCDGELQFDAAVDPQVAARKAPGSPLAGRANIFIFPSLEAGNIAYKVTQRLGGYDAYGPLLQGLARPFSDLSRGATSKDIVVASWINLARSKPMAGAAR